MSRYPTDHNRKFLQCSLEVQIPTALLMLSLCIQLSHVLLSSEEDLPGVRISANYITFSLAKK